MRISDWSSDVCSSDLSVAGAFQAELPRRAQIEDPGGEHTVLDDVARPVGQPLAIERLRAQAAAAMGIVQDRKSVVEGQSVSGRVDLGGRRILKKKKLH